MTYKLSNPHKIKNLENFYSRFDDLDGSHPWQEILPEGYVPYKVRELNAGKVVYFNFPLAKEMGLVSQDHPNQMTAQLEEKLIQTFSIQIINEYDILSKRRFQEHTIKPKPFMATRYLQLQHSDRQGRTSGDGRGIWNGVIRHKGRIWDVSSRGTGVTCLAPGAVQANRPLKTGGTEFGYGCGQAEIDELLGAALSAESMHLQGINTERVLCVIDLGRGVGIGVRASLNLIRPAHLFLYLKQGKWDLAKKSLDYLIQRQIQNKRWIPEKGNDSPYKTALNEICDGYAKFAATLETDYIFAWMDWDGDNCLADAGIIDYGSIRQFGIRHDKYRYDDVERFSTTLNEQKQKARLIVQVFCQLIDFVETKNRKPLSEFKDHSILARFDQGFQSNLNNRFLYRLGLNEKQRSFLVEKDPKFIGKLKKHFDHLEKFKVIGKIQKVADGINHPAMFNMRKTIKLLNDHIVELKSDESPAPLDHLVLASLSNFAKARDKRVALRQIKSFENLKKALLELYSKLDLNKKQLHDLMVRAERLNDSRRITGNALIQLIDQIVQEKRKGLPPSQIQAILDRLILDHLDIPESTASEHHKNIRALVPAELMTRLQKIILECREEI